MKLKLIILILLITTIIGWCVSVKSKNNTIKRQQFIIDSLNQELFVNHIELERYDITTEIFEEKHPKSAKEFKNILQNETE
jgi:hypothetical protein